MTIEAYLSNKDITATFVKFVYSIIIFLVFAMEYITKTLFFVMQNIIKILFFVIQYIIKILFFVMQHI